MTRSRQLFRHEEGKEGEGSGGCDCLPVKAWWIIRCNRIIKRMVRCIIWFHLHCNWAFISWLRERERILTFDGNSLFFFFIFFFFSTIEGNGRYWEKYHWATLRYSIVDGSNRDLGIWLKYEMKFFRNMDLNYWKLKENWIFLDQRN